jgi:hypothetical protein
MLIYGGTRVGNALATRFPAAMLSLLDRIILHEPRVPPHNLRSILDMIVIAGPTLRQDERWLRLDRLAG